MPSTINKDVMIIIIVIIIHIDPRYGGGSRSTGETDPGICCTEGPFCCLQHFFFEHQFILTPGMEAEVILQERQTLVSAVLKGFSVTDPSPLTLYPNVSKMFQVCY